MFAAATDVSVQVRATPSPSVHSDCVADAICVLRDGASFAGAPFDDDARHAVSVIYAAYAGMLLQTARRMLQSEADAQDAVHDLFCRLPRLIARYAGRSFGAWLKCAVVSQCLMHMRRVRAHRECAQDEQTLSLHAPCDERDDDLDHALKRLPPLLREVIVFRYFLSYSHREIATLLDITEAASEIRACRAIKQLRLMLPLNRKAGNREDCRPVRGSSAQRVTSPALQRRR